jgi:hypothetical protein
MKVALNRKWIAVVLVVIMLSALSVVVYAALLSNSNTITSTQTIVAPVTPTLKWVEPPPTAFASESFGAIVNVGNPNPYPLTGWFFNVTVTGSGLQNTQTFAPNVQVSMSTYPLSEEQYYEGLEAYSVSSTQITFISEFYPTFPYGSSQWGIDAMVFTSGSLTWYVTLVSNSTIVPHN